MQSILVPTDFSACASHALEAGIQLAKRFGATLHLYHKVDVWPQSSKDDPETTQRINNAKVLFKDIQQSHPEIELNFECSTGDFLKDISKYVDTRSIDLIVMGSHGASGKLDYLIGSNTQKVVRQVHCPVLVIKHPIEDLNFKDVVYASNFNVEERPAFETFVKLIKPFNPVIHLVAIQTSSLFEAPLIVQLEAMKDFQALAAPLTCQPHIRSDYSIDAGVRFFAQEIAADLIVISNLNRHPLKRVFVGSNVEAVVNHADLPVLTIDRPQAPKEQIEIKPEVTTLGI